MNRLEYLMENYIVGLDNYECREQGRIYHIIIYTTETLGPSCEIKGSNLNQIINKAYEALEEK